MGLLMAAQASLPGATETPPTEVRRRGWAPGFYGAAGTAALVMAVAPRLGLPCDQCASGTLASALPWAAVVLYFGLGWAGLRRRLSGRLASLPPLYLMAHASLIVESVLDGRWCFGCISVAVLAGGAAAAHSSLTARTPWALAIGLAMGSVLGTLSPLGRIDDALARRLWPARVLRVAPPFADRAELLRCGHESPVKLFLYERPGGCRRCGGATKRLLPLVKDEFPANVCIHVREVPNFPADQQFPVFVLMSLRLDLYVIEGFPSYADLRTLLINLGAAPK